MYIYKPDVFVVNYPRLFRF